MLNRYESLSKQCEIQCSITMRFQWIEVSETLTQISPLPFASQIIMKCNLHLNNNIMMKIIIIFWQINYRHEQPNWEDTVCKFQDFYANFSYLKPQNLPFWLFEQLCILNVWKVLTFPSVIFFKKIKIVEMSVFDLLKSAKINFT